MLVFFFFLLLLTSGTPGILQADFELLAELDNFCGDACVESQTASGKSILDELDCLPSRPPTSY